MITNETQPDLIDAARSGNRLETLIALRDFLAERLQNTDSGRDIASMSRRLMQCMNEIETLEQIRDDQREREDALIKIRRDIR